MKNYCQLSASIKIWEGILMHYWWWHKLVESSWKKTLEIYNKPILYGRWKYTCRGNVPPLQATTDSPEFILLHQEIGFLVLVRQQDLYGIQSDKCWNSENWCRFNWVILGNLSLIWFHMVSCIFLSLCSQDFPFPKEELKREGSYLANLPAMPQVRWCFLSFWKTCFQVIWTFISLFLNSLDMGVGFHETSL